MSKKSDLLKELGWSDDLIRHFLVEDSYVIDYDDQNLITEVYDSHSMTVVFDSENFSCSSYTVIPSQEKN